jgi:hypothetical protein
MLTANLKFINKSSGFFSFFAMFYIGNRITSDSYSRSKYLGHPLVKTNMFHYVPIKHKQLSFMSNGGIFKLYTVPNGLLFSSLTQPRFSFERMLPTYIGVNYTNYIGIYQFVEILSKNVLISTEI